MVDLGATLERVRQFAADCDPYFAAAVDRIADLDEHTLLEQQVVRPPASILRTVANLTTRPASARGLLEAVQIRLDDLSWYPAPTTVPPDVLDRLAAAEFVGPAGERHAEDVRLGVFVMEPATDFPSHRHSASEFYAVVAGTATWIIDDEQARLEPGEVVEIPRRTWHAIRTGPQPMLCCYLWTGTVDFDDYEFRHCPRGSPT